MPLTDNVREGVRTLTPGYFALVMASGIVSIALGYRGLEGVSLVLLGVAVAAHVVLVGLNVWRFVAFREELVADFKAPTRAFGFFTFVAGTNVVGARVAAEGWYAATAALLVVSAGAWLVLGYVIPWSAVLGRAERPVVALANGTWFIWVVASQSVAVAASALAPAVAGSRGLAVLALLAVLSWSVGVLLYAACAIFVSLRMMLYPLEPEDLDPPYWVAMGALAITVVAGAQIARMDSAPMVDATRTLIAGLSVVFWSFATWLVPVLCAAGVWRHFVRRVPLRYGATLWSIVFPLGMYSVASMYVGRVDRLPLVEAVGHAWIWVALVAWLVVGAAMARHVGLALTGRLPGG